MCYAPLGAHSHRMLIRACNPMSCPFHLCRAAPELHPAHAVARRGARDCLLGARERRPIVLDHSRAVHPGVRDGRRRPLSGNVHGGPGHVLGARDDDQLRTDDEHLALYHVCGLEPPLAAALQYLQHRANLAFKEKGPNLSGCFVGFFPPGGPALYSHSYDHPNVVVSRRNERARSTVLVNQKSENNREQPRHHAAPGGWDLGDQAPSKPNRPYQDH